MQTEKGINGLTFSTSDMTRIGWTLVGTATIEVDFVSVDQMVDNKVAALRQEAISVRAEATARCTQIEGQINQLLAIENSPAVVA